MSNFESRRSKNRPPPQQQQQPQQPPVHQSIPHISLNLSAKPFTPPPQQQRQQQQQQQQPLQQKSPQPPTDVSSLPDVEDVASDADIDSEDEFEEFESIIQRLTETNPLLTQDETEALANEIFYSKRTPIIPSSALSVSASPFIPTGPKPTQTTPVTSPVSPAPQKTATASSVQPVVAEAWCSCCENYPVGCIGSQRCLDRGLCVCVNETDEQIKRDTWVPASLACPCCSGFVYRCKAQDPQCKSRCNCDAFKTKP